MTKKKKTVDTLVKDIYDLVSTKETPKGVDLDKCIDEFGEGVKSLMQTLFSEKRNADNRTLRMSNIGRDDRYLWHVAKGSPKEELLPHTYMKFMYGHLIEELLLFLTKASGHTVTDEQKRCEINGIQGSQDCRIDGVITDIKSASTYGFKKFKEGTLEFDDPFGYIAQIKAYAKAQGATEGGWLALEKQNGHLTYLKMDLSNNNIDQRIDELKAVVASDAIPPVCEEPVPDGKSGNLKLPVKCSYCAYKKSCYPNLRTFLYSRGPVHLVKVVNEPKVVELFDEQA